MTNNNPLDPSYWEAMGITPIIINPNDADSIDDGIEKLCEAIKEIAEKEKEEEE